MKNNKIISVLSAMLLIAIVVGSAGAQSLTADDAGALMGIIRQVAAGGKAAGELPAALTAGNDARLIVSAFRRGNRAASVSAAAGTLASSATQAAELLAKAMAGQATAKSLAESVLVVDIVTKRRAVTLDPNAPIGATITIGGEGLAITSKGITRFFSPTVALAHSGETSFLSAIYSEAGEQPPPLQGGDTRAEAFETQSFAEPRPGGGARELSFGNVPVNKVDPLTLLRAYSAGAAWILRMQQEDGLFAERYDPLLGKRLPGNDMVVELRAVQRLLPLYAVVGDRDLRDAADTTIALAKKRVVDTGGAQPFSYAKFAAHDELVSSVALLQALCVRAGALGKTDDQVLMEGLGRFILDMTTNEGAVYLTLKSRAAGEPPPLDSGGVAEEAVAALCALTQQTPPPTNAVWLEKAQLILKHQLASADKVRPNPLLIQALATVYGLKDDKQYAEQCIQLADRLKDNLCRPDEHTPPADVGGWSGAGAPTTGGTAICLKALVAAHRIKLLTEGPEKADTAAILATLRFVMNQQFRPENTFYLQNAQALQGAFRAGSRDLLATLDGTSCAVDALMCAQDVLITDAAR